MRSRWKRRSLLVLWILILVLVTFSPGLPWSRGIRHTLKKSIVRAEMKVASLQGHQPRLMSIEGVVNQAGAQVQALDSRSGWATLADREGRFVLPDVMWYPRAVYELVISNDDSVGRLIKVRGPVAYPDSGVFHAGELNANQGSEVELASLSGVNSITHEDFDSANIDYYKDLFDKLTAGKESDEEKIGAIFEYVARKLNYQETQWELGSPRRVLERGSEYCGHLSAAMETLVAIGNYRTRAVNGTDGKQPPGTHVVVEVFYKGGWHLYDPTFGVKFHNKEGQIASYKDMRLDTTVITEDLFVKFDPQFRRKLTETLPAIYQTGYHHFYYFKNN
jgi:transglutaminase superfamily protein